MPNYIEIILLVAPGFIAQRTSRWLGNFSNENPSQFDSVMSYFSYSLFAGVFSAGILMFLGILPYDILTKNYEDIIQNNIQLLKICIIMILCSVFTGLLWQIVFKVIVKKFLNLIYSKTHNGNSVYDGGSLMVSELSDGEDHLLIIKKEEQEIACGRFLGISADASDRPEIALESYSVYKEWIEAEPDVFVRKRTYVVIQDKFVVEEYDYPEGFFQNKYEGKKENIPLEDCSKGIKYSVAVKLRE